MSKVVEELDVLLPDAKIIQDVATLLDRERFDSREIFPGKGIFSIDEDISIVLKQFLDWRFDIVASPQQYVTVVVALGNIQERPATFGAVDASYGFATLFYDLDGNYFRIDWNTEM